MRVFQKIFHRKGRRGRRGLELSSASLRNWNVGIMEYWDWKIGGMGKVSTPTKRRKSINNHALHHFRKRE
jgi:hypothetical protein